MDAINGFQDALYVLRRRLHDDIYGVESTSSLGSRMLPLEVLAACLESVPASICRNAPTEELIGSFHTAVKIAEAIGAQIQWIGSSDFGDDEYATVIRQIGQEVIDLCCVSSELI